MEPTVAHRLADAGAAAAFEALVGPWVEEMYRAAAAIVGEDDARDVTQEALVDAWRGFGRLRDPDRARPWLHAIVANRCRKHLRAKRSRPRLIAVRVPEGAVDDRSAALSERDRLDRAFDSLTADQRIAVVLHYVVDLSVPQIAAALSAPEGTIKSRIHVGIDRLRAALDSEGADERSR
jgi:RNA polymerase sigma-70 factor (ECF subfamily)